VGPLKLIGIIALLSSGRALADPLDRWTAPIAEASVRFEVPAEWIRRVMLIESGGQLRAAGRPIVSRAGAMGLMQLMPGTWREMRGLLGLGSNPHNPHDNILAGTAYLRVLYDRFGYPGLFAAYNAGPRRYADHLASGRHLPLETQAYLVRAMAASVRRQPRPGAKIVLASSSSAGSTAFTSSADGLRGRVEGLFVRLVQAPPPGS